MYQHTHYFLWSDLKSSSRFSFSDEVASFQHFSGTRAEWRFSGENCLLSPKLPLPFPPDLMFCGTFPSLIKRVGSTDFSHCDVTFAVFAWSSQLELIFVFNLTSLGCLCELESEFLVCVSSASSKTLKILYGGDNDALRFSLHFNISFCRNCFPCCECCISSSFLWDPFEFDDILHIHVLVVGYMYDETSALVEAEKPFSCKC